MPLLAAAWMSYVITVISTEEWKATQEAIAICLILFFAKFNDSVGRVQHLEQ